LTPKNEFLDSSSFVDSSKRNLENQNDLNTEIHSKRNKIGVELINSSADKKLDFAKHVMFKKTFQELKKLLKNLNEDISSEKQAENQELDINNKNKSNTKYKIFPIK
jgi:hypothetical protein